MEECEVIWLCLRLTPFTWTQPCYKETNAEISFSSDKILFILNQCSSFTDCIVLNVLCSKWVSALVLCVSGVLLISLTFPQCRCRLQSQSMQSGCRTRSPQRRGRGSQKSRPPQKRYLCGGGYWFRSACKVLSFPQPSRGQQWGWGEPRRDRLPENKIHGRFDTTWEGLMSLRWFNCHADFRFICSSTICAIVYFSVKCITYPSNNLPNHSIPVSTFVLPAIRSVLHQVNFVFETQFLSQLSEQIHTVAF